MMLKPTRMGLLLAKRRLKIASKGHTLLKDKQDGLVLEFFQMYQEIRKLRKELQLSYVEAERAFQLAEGFLGQEKVRSLADSMTEECSISWKDKRIMGVKFNHITEAIPCSQWPAMEESSPELDHAIALIRSIFPQLLLLAERELALRTLAEEIQKTKRKVNSLEHIAIPQLEHFKEQVSFKLEEQSREDFVRLKHFKKSL